MTAHAIQIRRWTQDEYEKMIASGIFDPEDRLELIDGDIFEMTPQSSRHAGTVGLVAGALDFAFPPGYNVRVQSPLALGDDSEPEPDIAVVSGSPRDYLDAHPTTAVLVVEVADTSLAHDQHRKTGLYAANGIPEYWILNLVDNRLEVYRDPAEAVFRSRVVLGKGDAVSPLARPEISIPVSELLP